MPKTPKDMSTTDHQKGISRIGPQIRASGMMPTQASMPNSTTRTLRTGSRQTPWKATAMTRWAKAGQSLP